MYMYTFLNTGKLNRKVYDMITFSEANKDDKNKKKPDEKAELSTDDISIIVMGKALDKMNGSLRRVITLNEGSAKDIVDSAKKIQGIAEAFAKASNDKSSTLKTFDTLIKTTETFSKYFKALDKEQDKVAANVLTGGLLLMVVEASAIIAEAINEIGLGKVKTFDDYILKIKMYKSTFEIIEETCDEKLSKLQAELFKEDFSGESGYDSLGKVTSHIFATSYFSEGSSVSLLRVMKAMLFKTLYFVMSPVRYIIYLFLYAGFSISERIQQIKDTIEVYDGSGAVSGKEVKMNSLEKKSNVARVDRIKASAKAEETIEEDRNDAAKDVNKTSSSLSF